MLELIAASDDPWSGMAFLLLILFLCLISLFAGFRLGRKSSVPEPVYQAYRIKAEELEDRKNAYRNLCERFSAMAHSVSALVYSLQARQPSEELSKIERALESFEGLTSKNIHLSRNTPGDLDIADIVKQITSSNPIEGVKQDAGT